MDSLASETSSEDVFRIAIVGSGPIGRLLACSAVPHPRTQIVRYEADTSLQRLGLGYGIGPQTLRAAKALNPELGKRFQDKCIMSRDWVHCWHGGDEDRYVANIEVPEGDMHGWISREDILGVLDGMLPPSKSQDDIHYGKRLVDVRSVGIQQVELSFHDGTTDIVNAVWAADGLNSFCRKLVQGEAFRPASHAGFLAFRGKVATRKFVDQVGEQFSKEPWMFIGVRGWHIITFPIEGNDFLNVSAYCVSNAQERLGWSNEVTMDDVLHHFPGRNQKVDAVLRLVQSETVGGCQRFEIRHLSNVETLFNQDLCMTLFGDAANGMTPHLAGSMSTGFIGSTTFLNEEWNPRILSGKLPADASNAEIAAALAEASRGYDAKHRPLAQKLLDLSDRQGAYWSGGVTDLETLREGALALWHAADDKKAWMANQVMI